MKKQKQAKKKESNVSHVKHLSQCRRYPRIFSPSPIGARRSSSSLHFSLSNIPAVGTSGSSPHGGVVCGHYRPFGNGPSVPSTSQPKGCMVAYRSEPLFIQPARRTTFGIPEGWKNNYFLEFAPNVRNLVAQSDISAFPKCCSKEEFMEEFWRDLGHTPHHQKQLGKQDFAPHPWEVREKLKEFINKKEDEVVKKMEEGKYPIIIKGEIDQDLRKISVRKKRRKLQEKEKDQEYVKKARNSLKEKDSTSSKSIRDNKERDLRKKMKSLFETTRNQYHRSVAPTRFFSQK